MDESENTVAGTLNAIWLSDPVEINCDVWGLPEPVGITTSANPADGTFSCDFDAVGHDLQKGDQVALTYYDGDGNSVTNESIWPWMVVNYGHDSVGGIYSPGHTFWITVT